MNSSKELKRIEKIHQYRSEGLKDHSIDDQFIVDLLESRAAWFNTAPLDIIHSVIGAAVSYIPVVGSLVGAIVDILWPASKVDIFKVIENQVTQLVNSHIDAATGQRLEVKIKEISIKMKFWSKLLRQKKYMAARSYYGVISMYLVGIEENFKITGSAGKKYHFTPLYCIIVDLVIAFRVDVINNFEKLHLSKDEADVEAMLLSELLLTPTTGACAYLKSVARTCYDDTLKASKEISTNREVKRNAMSLFKSVVEEYSYFVRSGVTLSKSNVWMDIAKNPSSRAYRPFNFVILMPALGSFRYDFDNFGELFKLLADTNITDKKLQTLDTITLLQMKDDNPDVYKRMCGVELKYTNPSSTVVYGYTGGSPGAVTVGRYSLSVASNSAVLIGIYTAGKDFDMAGFIDSVTVQTRDLKVKPVSVGHSPANNVYLYGDIKSPYKIQKIFCGKDHYSHKSGHQTMGIITVFAFDNEFAKASKF
ncbi:insecticidal delta-endotoxin Cry8Ea1 family protein [Pseudomonas aeruginosa]